METGATCMEGSLLPTSMEVGESFNGSSWEQMETFIEVDEAVE